MTLKAKQQAQVNKAPQAQRATLTAMYKRQNSNNSNKPQQQQQQQLQPLKPQPKRLLARPAKASAVVPVPKSLNWAFDGFDKRHLPTDELTAPYTTTNFVTTMEFGSRTAVDQVLVVCPRMFEPQEHYVGGLTDFIAILYDASETISGTIPILQSIRCPIVDQPTITADAIWTSVRARLHNMSVRISCVGTNTGLYSPGSVFIGSVPMIETGPRSGGGQESLSIKQAWAEDSMAVGYLRPISAASLQERPVVLNAAVAESVSYKQWRDIAVPSTAKDVGSLGFSTALEPIVLYIPRAGAGDTVVNYRLEVGQQWCSRHPHNIMLRATQKQHPATSPGAWHQASAAVKDIGEHMLSRAGGIAIDALAGSARAAVGM